METTSTTAELVETGDQRDRLERRAELLAEYRQSGLTQTAFARREGLKYSTFCTWAQEARTAGRLPMAPAGTRRSKPAASSAVRFAEVALPGRAAALEVRLPDGTVASGTNAVELAAFVRALRS